jgi:carboxymethylenebutenolidase
MPNIEITAADGGTFAAYLSTPKSGKGPGIVLMHAIFGVNDEMRVYADDFAAHGFVVVLPEMFWRIERGVELKPGPEGGRRAMELSKSFNTDTAQGVSDLQAAVSWLRAHPACTGKVGTVGYCLGGKMAYLMALDSDADCNVGYFGVGIERLLDHAPRLSRPLMLHIPERDEHCAPESQAEIKRVLAGKAEMFGYAGAGHAFNRVGGPHYHAEATAVSHARTDRFLKQHLQH